MGKCCLCAILIFQAIQSLALSTPDSAAPVPLLFRGTEYTKIIPAKNVTPFLYDEFSDKGTVIYYGFRYDRILLQYDAEDDALVSKDLSGNIRMQLVREKVQLFILGPHTFKRIEGIGFVEEMYKGATSVYVKWQKVPVRRGVEDMKYELYRKVYLLNKGTLVTINNRNDVLRIFGNDRKKAMDFSRASGLNFKKDLPHATAEMMRYFDKSGKDE